MGAKEFNTEYFNVNKDGELVIFEGNYQYNVFDLARKFGASVEIFMPFVVEERLSHVYKVANQNIKRVGYKGKFTYHFPIKVNQNKETMLPLLSEGAHLETSSANHLWLVKKLWLNENFHAKIRVVCNGAKTPDYITLIKELKGKGLSIVPVIESIEEYNLLKGYGGDLGIRINLKTRVKSHWDKKIDQFGLDLNEILDLGKIRGLKMLHYHQGMQMEVENDIFVSLKEGYESYKKIRALNPTLDTLNIGGGFGIPYEKRKKMYSVESVLSRLFKNLKTWCERDGIPHPNLIIEWGSYITAPAQMTVYRIVSSKAIPKGVAKYWYLIDGSFQNDLLDTWAIHRKWHVVPANHMDAKHKHRVWFAGISCDSDDKFTGNDYLLMPRLEDLPEGEDQYVAVFDTGAYQDSFTSHHCFLSSPTKVVLQNGIVTVARKRESPEDVGKIFGW